LYFSLSNYHIIIPKENCKMSHIKRRHFLQGAGSTLATLGLSQADFLRQAHNYGQVLAQSTPRKLALLVGINNYPAPNQLGGCLTDVDLQRELLVHRFGFNPQNILELRDGQATRQGILDAFETHLIQQAKPGDVVVFHYSGHGARVMDADPNPGMVFNRQGFNSTIVPIDREIPNSDVVRDIMGHTLFLLTSALATDQVTMILDSCFSGGGLRGNNQIRSYRGLRSDRIDARPSPTELDYQNRWLADKRVNLTPQEFSRKRKVGIAKGIAMGASLATQEALEAPEEPFEGNLQAGAFTYLLTRYLWQLSTAQSVATVFDYLALSTDKLTGRQNPVLEPAEPTQMVRQKPAYFLAPTQPAAEAVVHKVPGSNQEIPFWLGGVSPKTLVTYQPGAKFDIIDLQGKSIGVIELTERDRLQAVGKLLPDQKITVTKGMLLREQVKGVPLTLTLKVGLDVSLGENRAAIQQALRSMNRIEVLSVNPQQSLDCLLGRMTASTLQQLSLKKVQNLPPEKSFGLFNPDLTPIADSYGSAGEGVDSAIGRLRSRLKSLLARKVLKTVLGEGNSSPLRVSADIIQVDAQGRETIVKTMDSRGHREAAARASTVPIPAKLFAPETNLYVQVQNAEAETLYMAVLVISDGGELNVLYPIGDTIDAALVPKNGSQRMPYPLITQGPAGYFELLVIASRYQLRDALKAVTMISSRRGIGRGEPVRLEEDESLQVVNELLGDVSRAGAKAGVRGIDTRSLATLSAVLQVSN
jgi:hypothetical protein